MRTSTVSGMDPDELAASGLRYDVSGAVATVTLDRPDVRNAQTPRMWRALAAIGAEIPDAVRIVVLRGAGQSFSAGLDRAMLDPRGVEGESVFGMLAGSDDEASATIDAYQQGFTWLRDPRFVSIAAVQGHAIGAGFQLALSCDLRVLATTPSLAMKESALGLVPDLTGTKPLVEAVGYATSPGDLRNRADRRGRRGAGPRTGHGGLPAGRARRHGRRPGGGALRGAPGCGA